MYIGGTDEKALHHLFAEVIDNAMDEALAGHATFIEVDLAADGTLAVTDNGRGIPVDAHPKFPKKSALEFRLKQPPLPWLYMTVILVLVLLFDMLPYLQELVRGLRGRGMAHALALRLVPANEPAA
jgi:hypothetical protein